MKISRARLLFVAAVVALALVLAVTGGVLLDRLYATPFDRPAAAWWTDRAAIGRGARDFATGSCISCHTLAGVSSANAATDLSHEGRRRAPAWLLREISHPTSQRPPTPPGQARDLAAYLSSLR